MPIKYVIGIDLGTTNCALAYAPEGGDPREQPPVALFDVPQLVNPGEVRDQPLLPSFLYLPGSSDFPAGSIALPWDDAPESVVGSLAQKRGAEVASRLRSLCATADHHFWPDSVSPTDDTLFRLSTIGGHRKITDAYLLGLAVRNHGRLATFDRSIPLKAVQGADPGDVVLIGSA